MKTLDEVIEAYEYCINNNYRDCRGCPYGCQDGESGCTNAEEKTDALHYLKEYREKHDDILRMEEALGYCEIMDNPALSWDELKEMGGKPVWVVEEGYQTWEYWSLVYWMKDDELTLLNENGRTTYSKNEQGTVWQAYRKERG